MDVHIVCGIIPWEGWEEPVFVTDNYDKAEYVADNMTKIDKIRYPFSDGYEVFTLKLC